MTPPLVSIICLCYNHAPFLAEALDSVFAQTYPHLEIIVADDASTDASAAIILDYCCRFPQIKFIQNRQNVGNCAAFNLALAQATGEFVVDFATDDVMLPQRLTEQVNAFTALTDDYGVVYTDALLIDEFSRPIRNFYRSLPNGQLGPEPVSGWIYEDLVKRFFISAPTMLIKRAVFNKLGGYNEKLAYEDFDFWVRSGRYFKYYFLNQTLTKRRLHPQQLSKRLYQKHDKQLASTVQVCFTALRLNRTASENTALAIRVKYEFKKAVSTANFAEASQLAALLRELKALSGIYKLAAMIVTWQLKLSKLVRAGLRNKFYDSNKALR